MLYATQSRPVRPCVLTSAPCSSKYRRADSSLRPRGHLRIVQLLMSKGANPFITYNDDGFTALMTAVDYGYVVTVKHP